MWSPLRRSVRPRTKLRRIGSNVPVIGSTSTRNAWLATPATKAQRCWLGWCMSKSSSRTSPCSTNHDARIRQPRAFAVVARSNRATRPTFAYDHCRDAYHSPTGKWLHQYRRRFKAARDAIDKNGMRRYRASKLDCGACDQLIPNPHRTGQRSSNRSSRSIP